GVRRLAVDRGKSSRLQRRLSLGRVGVDDDGTLPAHRLQDVDAHEAEPAGADDDDRLLLEERPHPLQRTIGGEAGAGIGRRLDRVERADVEEIAGVRRDDVVGIAARAEDAEKLRLEAELLLAAPAHRAAAAAEPGKDEALVADL